MLRKILANGGIQVSDSEFKEIMTMVTADIKANRILFNKNTSIEQVFNLAVGAFIVLKRCTSFVA